MGRAPGRDSGITAKQATPGNWPGHRDKNWASCTRSYCTHLVALDKVLRSHLFDISTGRERPLAASQDDGPDGDIGLKLLQGCANLVHQGTAQRIQRCRGHQN